MNGSAKKRMRGFSLIELVIVVVILGIIAAIAIPRMSRGSEGAADAALRSNLAVLRNAVELFKVEHEGLLPTDSTTIATQLTEKTDADGNVDDGMGTGGPFIYGPYVRAIPTLPVGSNQGSADFSATQTGTAGWVYDSTTGDITANLPSTEVDAENVAYSSY